MNITLNVDPHSSMLRDTCWFCGGRWGSCVCNFVCQADLDSNVDLSLLDGFDDDDNEYFITEPNVSVCGRFYVDPVEYYGGAFVRWWRDRTASPATRRMEAQ